MTLYTDGERRALYDLYRRRGGDDEFAGHDGGPAVHPQPLVHHTRTVVYRALPVVMVVTPLTLVKHKIT